MGPVTSVPFKLVGPYRFEQVMPAWAPHFPQFDTVVGYSDLGHAFLMSTRTGEYAVLDPYSPGTKGYGAFPDVTAFINRVLFDPDFLTYVLQPQHVSAIRRRLGRWPRMRSTSPPRIRSSAVPRIRIPMTGAVCGCFSISSRRRTGSRATERPAAGTLGFDPAAHNP